MVRPKRSAILKQLSSTCHSTQHIREVWNSRENIIKARRELAKNFIIFIENS